jgi:hypothetical protein
MVVGYHVVLGMYGFWLPNDPRGSGSDFVWSEDLRRFGPATKVTTRHSRAHDRHDVQQRLAAKEALKFPPVEISDGQREWLAIGIARGAEATAREIWACAILRTHVHLVFSRNEELIERTVCEVKRQATWELTRNGMHPLSGHRMPNGRLHSPWGRGFWKVYLNGTDDVERTLRYVNDNPARENLPRQSWPFVMKPDF